MQSWNEIFDKRPVVEQEPKQEKTPQVSQAPKSFDELFDQRTEMLKSETTPVVIDPIQGIQKAAPTDPNQAKDFYSTSAFSAPIQGLAPMMWSPEIASYLGKQGFGPKPEGGWDELGVPLGKDGEPYYQHEKATGIAAETLQGLTSLAGHPMEVIRGGLDFALSIPGFMTGLMSASSAISSCIIDNVSKNPIYDPLRWDSVEGTTLEDFYNIAAEEMQKSMEFFDPGKKLLTGQPTHESDLATQVVMAPLTGLSMLGHKVADYEGFKNSPNIRGAARFAGDALGMMTMGILARRGNKSEPIKSLARKTEEVVKEASEIITHEQAVQINFNEIIKQAEQKVIDARKTQLELKAKEIAKEIAEEAVIKGEEVRQVNGIIEAKGVKPVEPKPEVKLVQVDPPKPQIEPKPKPSEFKIPEFPESKITFEEPLKRVTELDRQTGVELPGLKSERSPFFQDKETTETFNKLYTERAKSVATDPELFVQKLINDANKWFHGDESIPINKVREGLSSMATKADELRMEFLTGTDHLMWKETVREAAEWARNLDRLKIKRTEGGVEIHSMIPLSKTPEAVRSLFKDTKEVVSNKLFRNKEVFDKTGFWLARDGKWRYEISDYIDIYDPSNKIQFNWINLRNKGKDKLNNVYKSEKLYKAFPELKDVTIKVDSNLDVSGHYIPGSNTIHLKYPSDRKILIHELQHIINEKAKSKFTGSDIEVYDTNSFYDYLTDSGEMESRLVEKRISMNKKQRSLEAPWETLDKMLKEEKIHSAEGHSLYSGISSKEAKRVFHDLVENSDRAFTTFKTSVKEKKFDFNYAVNQIKADTLRALWDQSETLLNVVRKNYPQEYNKIVSRQRSAITGKGYGRVLYEQASKEIYSGKNKQMVEAINEYILFRRFKDIYSYRTEKGYKHQVGYDPEAAISASALIEMIKDLPSGVYNHFKKRHPKLAKNFGDLTPKQMAEVVKAADTYFEWSRKMVDDLVEAGLKTPEEGKLLKAHDFRKFKTIKLEKLYDFDYSLTLKGETIRTTNSGVKNLGLGSTKMIDPDARTVFSEQFSRVYGSIANQAAKLEWKALAEKHPENGFVSIKQVKNWSPMPYMDKGVRKNIYFHPDAAKYLVTQSKDMSPRLATVIRTLTAAPVTKFLAVGGSPTWATLTGIPMDFMHTLWTAKTWEADAKGIRPKVSFPFYETTTGKFKKVYSPFAGVGPLQLGHDMSRTLGDVISRGPLTQNLMKHGLVMNFLTQRHSRYMKGTKPPGDWAKMMDLLSYHGLSMELWIRASTADRVIRRKAKEQGISYEKALKDKDIMYESVHCARDRMDYNQGGWLVKSIDQAGVIFLNAGVLGTRTFWRQATSNPVDFTFRTAQLMSTAAGITAMAWMLYPDIMKDTSTKGNEKNVIWPLAPRWLKTKDIDGNDVTFNLRLRMDPSAAFFYKMSENLTKTYMYDQGMIKEEPDYQEVARTLKALGPVNIQLPPSIQMGVEYVSNYSWWKERQMYTELGGKTLPWGDSKHEGLYDEHIPQMAKDLGQLTGGSPKRIHGAGSNVIPYNNEFAWMLGKGYELAFSDVPEEMRKQHWLITLAEIPGINKVVGITRHGQGRWAVKTRIDNEIELKRMIRTNKFDMLATRNAWYGVDNKKELMEFIKSQKDIDIIDNMMDDLDFVMNPLIKKLPHRNFWLSVKHSSVEGKARIWLELIRRVPDYEKDQLRKELTQVAEMEGIITDKFFDELEKIQLEK